MILLLSPQQLLTSGIILHLLEINKSGKSVSYETSELTNSEIKKRFSKFPKEKQDLFKTFSSEGIRDLKIELKGIYASQR